MRTHKNPLPSFNNYQHLATIVILKFMPINLIFGSTVGLFPLSVGPMSLFLVFLLLFLWVSETVLKNYL